MTWEVKKLGEVLKLEYGKPLPKEDRYSNGKYPVYGANGIKDRTDEIYFDKKSIIVGRKGSAGEVNLTEEGFWPLDVTYFVTFDNEKYDLIYLYYLLKNLNLQKLAKGVKPGINRNDIYHIESVFPSIQEQRQIVTILGKAFEKISKAKENDEKNLKNAKEVFESYIQSVFEDIRENCSNEKLGNLCTFVRGPFGGSLKKSYFKPSGFAVYEQQHAINGQFENIRYYIDVTKFEEMKRFELLEGDLVMSCSGTMGKIAIVPNNIHRGIINQALLKLTPHNKIDIFYLKIWMESQDFQNQLSKFSKGAAIKNVASVKILKEIDVPLPDLKKQREIIQRIDVYNSKTKKLEQIYQKKLQDLEELKKSILQKAFNGELTEC